MRNEFIYQMRQAMTMLRGAQEWHQRRRAKADAKLDRARAVHAKEVAEAEFYEAYNWNQLMSVEGVTPLTASRLMNVSETTIAKWSAKYTRGVANQVSPLAASIYEEQQAATPSVTS